MTFASHPERQFMQYLRGGAGWIKAGALPLSARLIEKLLQKGWIERQQKGPKNEVFLRLTEKGLEAKRSLVPTRRAKVTVSLQMDPADLDSSLGRQKSPLVGAPSSRLSATGALLWD
jgi:hypothetical protein